MSTDYLSGTDTEALRAASLFRKMRALCRTMRKGVGWRLTISGAIRLGTHSREAENQCPLTFVGGITGSSAAQAGEVAHKLGLHSEAGAIMSAADGPPFRAKLRHILLRAAGLHRGGAR